MQNKEIEEMKYNLKQLYHMLGKKPSISKNAINNVLQYIDQLESKVKELGKGQHILMYSRKKWKNKYYKERKIRREADKAVSQIYEDYQDIGNMYFNLDEKRQQAIEYLIKMREGMKKDQYTAIYYLEGIEKIIKMLGVVANDN